MKRIWLLVLLILVGVFFLFRKSDPFNLSNLYREIEQGEVYYSSEFNPSCLTQNFHFLNQGSQIYAFISDDGQTVLKVFKATHEKPFKWERFFRKITGRNALFQQISRENWKRKFLETCERYEMAFQDLQTETGLLHLHLKKTENPLLKKICFLNSSGRQQFLDLNQYPFIVQKKATLVDEYLQELINQHQQEKALAAITSLRSLFLTRAQKGYSDFRQCLRINYGFVNDQPIQIDVGKIHYDPQLSNHLEEELKNIESHLFQWTAKHFPMLEIE